MHQTHREQRIVEDTDIRFSRKFMGRFLNTKRQVGYLTEAVTLYSHLHFTRSLSYQSKGIN